MNNKNINDDFMTYFKPLQDFVDIMDNVELIYNDLFERVGELDRETSDMLHDFEFDKFYRTEGHRKARKLKEIRQERRTAKNTMELLYPLKEYVKYNRKIKGDIKKVLEQIDRADKAQNTRVYAPRAMSNIGIAQKHFESKTINIKKRVV